MLEGLPRRIGKYRVLCKLGHGGMAVVYLARGAGPAGFCRLFALKTIHPTFNDERAFVEMFFDEARLAARIHHPNSVPVYEVGTDAGLHYIAMDYVNGETLATTLLRTWKDSPPFPIPLTILIIEGVSEALHAAHELTDGHGVPLGVVHRDVSPQNILVGYDGVARIADFGVAKAADQLAHTRTGSQKGKLSYMSPEQISGQTIDRRADVFALGTVLWESLTGLRLFKKDSDFATIEEIRSGHVPDVRSIRPDAPASLHAVVRRALALDPNDRFATAREFAQELRAVGVRHNLLAATSDLERHMRSTFADRYAKRLEIGRRASKEGFVDTTAALALHSQANLRTSPSDEAERYAPVDSPIASEDRPFVPTLFGFGARATLALGAVCLVTVTAVITTLLVVGSEQPTRTSFNRVVMPETTEVALEPLPPPVRAVRSLAPPPDRSIIQAPPPSVPDMVQLTFDVNASKWSARYNGTPVAGGKLEVPRSTEAIVVKFRAWGYHPKDVLVVPSQERTVKVKLKRRKLKRSKPKPPADEDILLRPEDIFGNGR